MLTEDTYFGDELRYKKGASEQRNGVSEGKGPVVVWNYTRSCNLKCRHCYAGSENKKYEGELTTEQALKVIDDLADFHVPVILFFRRRTFIEEGFLYTCGACRKERYQAYAFN
jgi:MoaA/NifB/PqqE/SkfB family radical SAM enzyme